MITYTECISVIVIYYIPPRCPFPLYHDQYLPPRYPLSLSINRHGRVRRHHLRGVYFLRPHPWSCARRHEYIGDLLLHRSHLAVRGQRGRLLRLLCTSASSGAYCVRSSWGVRAAGGVWARPDGRVRASRGSWGAPDVRLPAAATAGVSAAAGIPSAAGVPSTAAPTATAAPAATASSVVDYKLIPLRPRIHSSSQ